MSKSTFIFSSALIFAGAVLAFTALPMRSTLAQTPPAATTEAPKAADTDAAKADAKSQREERKAKRAQARKAKAEKRAAASAGRRAAHERQKQCGAEWREARAAGKVEKTMTWPKYWSACNTRLKAKAT
ncbi:hypothetical protein [Pseudorhodoplanes sinuspersici]|uniref:Uncharacterized protein n=1 Tax=Pseudorhodoplanes sinuspersici TaxID=1235591 RepID=A0A1W6ZWL5_9HYPH|nr:hypothetical protein [Pseudorhodoplanes sinuspersici]ARQ01772.1 hypothetical protein CAK95_23745 [Pseudorhodoplanes sinuspersici]RKE73520.1 hypothetical protein DFP91_1409 [Pseudorhodoplanes sinuspersici]